MAAVVAAGTDRVATAAHVVISTVPVSEAATGGKDKSGASQRFVPLSTSLASHLHCARHVPWVMCAIRPRL
jgi:hypothetical protein